MIGSILIDGAHYFSGVIAKDRAEPGGRVAATASIARDTISEADDMAIARD
jgi:hypothetical protein